MKVSAPSVCVLLCVLLSSCSLLSSSLGRDSWYTAPPEEAQYAGEWVLLEDERVHEVIQARLPDAEALLEDMPIVEITELQAEEFVGQTLPPVMGAQPYLVRGLCGVRATGGFRVSVLEDQLRVHHGSLGADPARMSRQPLVLQLESSPVQVYVTCSMAK
jgi:hypothetical protein